MALDLKERMPEMAEEFAISEIITGAANADVLDAASAETARLLGKVVSELITMFGESKDGKLGGRELHLVLSSLGEPLERIAIQVIDRVVRENGGAISRSEFEAMVLRSGAARDPTALALRVLRGAEATLEGRLEQALRMQAAKLAPPPPPPAEGREAAVTPATSGALEASMVGKGVLQAERGLASVVQMIGSMARFAGQRSRTAAGAAYVEAGSGGGGGGESGGQSGGQSVCEEAEVIARVYRLAVGVTPCAADGVTRVDSSVRRHATSALSALLQGAPEHPLVEISAASKLSRECLHVYVHGTHGSMCLYTAG